MTLLEQRREGADQLENVHVLHRRTGSDAG